jgi:hypothetical protein
MKYFDPEDYLTYLHPLNVQIIANSVSDVQKCSGNNVQPDNPGFLFKANA